MPPPAPGPPDKPASDLPGSDKKGIEPGTLSETGRGDAIYEVASEEAGSDALGIAPGLLSETGRASAIQDIADKAREVANRGAAVEKVLIDTITQENRIFKRRNRVLVVLVATLLLMNIYREYRSTFVTGPAIDSIDQTVNGPLADANTKLDKIQSFIDASVANNQSQLFFDLICATDDPVTVQFCLDHGLVQ